MEKADSRVPVWPDFVADLKTRGVWENPELRALAVAEWERLIAAQSAKDELPVVIALRSAGVEVSSVWDIVKSKSSFPEAMPILREHIGRDYPPGVREGMARAMSTTAAQPYWNDLITLYRSEGNKRVKDGLGVALSGIAGPSEMTDLIALLKDESNGTGRVLLISAPEDRAPRELAIRTLEGLLDDTAIGKAASIALKKMVRRARKK